MKWLVVLLVAPFFVFADEGMWLLNDFPVSTVQKKYNFKATPDWLEHVRLSSARLAGGCSASFVSKNGLVLTNHHCAHECIEQLSKKGDDRVAKGFYAKTLDDEVKCPEIEVNNLTEITDVTTEIKKAMKGLTGKEQNAARKAAMSKIEKACSNDSDDIRCDVVALFHGGKYQLYKYRRYQDVRLVFAPEMSIAFFGGDPDNFMFPRYDLDASFLRVYENGKPLQPKHYFEWSPAGVKENDLTFVTGHPGRTSRLLTVAEIEFIRDTKLIRDMLWNAEIRGMLTEFQKRGDEQRRISEGYLFSVENSLKAQKGRHLTLRDKKFFAQKVQAEKNLRAKVNANPKWKKEFGNAWDEIAKAEEELKKIYDQLKYIENTSYESKLFSYAKQIVRASVELPKPNEKRFREWADSNLPAVKQELFSAAPIYDEFETTMLTFAFTKLREVLTADHPYVKKVLGQKSPAELAKELVKGTKLKDAGFRKKLFDGGATEVEASEDPMIQLARLIDTDGREIRKKYEDEIESKIKQNSEKIARAQFAVYGTNTYPDATFSLRISYGTVKGYDENGKWVNPVTKMAGTYDRHTGREPFALPESWLKSKTQIAMETPMNFCSTNDIIGGNSGSPVIDKDAKIVGLIFDGNIQSLGGDYGYDSRANRAVAVHSSAIIEALEKVYGAKRIVQDLKGQTDERSLAHQ